MNCIYAAGRTIALIAVGGCVKLANPKLDWDALPDDAFINYGVIWLIAAVAAWAGIGILATTRDFRHETRSQSSSAA